MGSLSKQMKRNNDRERRKMLLKPTTVRGYAVVRHEDGRYGALAMRPGMDTERLAGAVFMDGLYETLKEALEQVDACPTCGCERCTEGRATWERLYGAEAKRREKEAREALAQAKRGDKGLRLTTKDGEHLAGQRPVLEVGEQHVTPISSEEVPRG
jgi:hypothetical protein